VGHRRSDHDSGILAPIRTVGRLGDGKSRAPVLQEASGR
jgi:hypothetical protein